MTHAWPELRRFCRERNVEPVEVDLRWGIDQSQEQLPVSDFGLGFQASEGRSGSAFTASAFLGSTAKSRRPASATGACRLGDS